MEAVAMLGQQTQVSVQDTEKHLKETLEQLGHTLFGDCQMRWVEAYFPFTHPSFELELLFDEKWVEMLGCGIIHQSVLDKAGRGSERGWAAGLGL
jgi:phenylalanyl-tRNA synthetase alpha chain